MNPTPHDDLADILAFYLEAGVDVAMGEAPVDRFAESAAEQARSRTQRPPAVQLPDMAPPPRGIL